MRINVGCGKKVLDDYINCDIVADPKSSRAPEIICDIRKIPLEDGCADEVLAIHILEHFYKWEAPSALREWKRLLKSGGELVLELPDILKCAKNLLETDDDRLHMWGFYGDPRDENHYMCHKWGWHPKSLSNFLKAEGFINIREEKPRWHPIGRDIRDMRIVANKP